MPAYCGWVSAIPKSMRYLFAFLLWIVASTTQAAGAEPPTAPPPVTWEHTGSKSFEAEHPGLGVSHRYSSPVGWIDVYLYSLGRKDWETGVGDAKFAEHFDSTVDEVRLYAQRGFYRELEVGAAQDVVVSGQTFRTVRFRYSREGKPMNSTTYLTARNGQLLKYRISILAATGLDLEVVARRFVEENLRDMPVQ